MADIKLTKGEFCQFNLKSKTMLLGDNGKIVKTKKINKDQELRLFLIYDFYVEVFYDRRKKRILRVEPMLNNTWFDFYSR